MFNRNASVQYPVVTLVISIGFAAFFPMHITLYVYSQNPNRQESHKCWPVKMTKQRLFETTLIELSERRSNGESLQENEETRMAFFWLCGCTVNVGGNSSRHLAVFVRLFPLCFTFICAHLLTLRIWILLVICQDVAILVSMVELLLVLSL